MYDTPSPSSAAPTAPLPNPYFTFTPGTTNSGNTPNPGYTQPGTAGSPGGAPTVPLLSSNNTPQPHAYPYLVDKFFYTGAANFYYPPTGIATDPSVAGVPVVGGPAGDGWFKMFDFFEVPSQMIGSIGSVASGTNFDWARQDTKPGLLNINLIIDEEVFFSVFGRQDSTLDQTLLNSIELPYLLNSAGALPYSMPLSTANNGMPPIPALPSPPPGPPYVSAGPPVPLVVSATTYSGAPNYVYPITNQLQAIEHGFLLSNDPIQQAINTTILKATPTATVNPPVGNRIKAAFAQFLWLRHGGSGYIFGFGNGATGQNSAVVNPVLTAATTGYSQALPSERYFHSLSYPDINYTIMRPAALPPSTVSLPAMVADTSVTNPTQIQITVNNAQAMMYTPPAADVPAPPTYFWINGPVNTASNPPHLPSYYAPYVTGNGNFGVNVPVVYSGDPGVRNPLLSLGYSTSSPAVTPPYSIYNPAPPTAANPNPQTTDTILQGYPLPINVAFPSGGVLPTMDSLVMPSPIPPRRLFQPPDYYGANAISPANSGYNGDTNLPPALSNATDSGDPWINNQIPNNPLTNTPAQTLPGNVAPFYTLNNGFATLQWSGGTHFAAAATAPLTPTGALPLVSTAYPPYGVTTLDTWVSDLVNLSYTSNSATVPPAAKDTYLGSGTSGSNTDDRQHPFFRSEQLQKVMNLTTVRTHQYAVWITIGFFEIIKQGDISMLQQGNPLFAYDVIGPEVGAVTGNNIRFRGFFLIDRTKLTGFNTSNTGSFRSAVVYRKVIQ
jgi:hypothetical protein